MSGEDSSEAAVVKSGSSLRGRQLRTLAVLCAGQFCLAACVSLQAPFFPREAEKKGASATVYGFIFGAFELAVIVSSPLYAKVMVWVTPNFLVIFGAFVAGACSILFGVLDRAPIGRSFIGLAFSVRILEGFACASFTTASYTVVAAKFPDKVATAFALLETSFGIGLIFGPTMGGLLYEVQGFPLPFQVMGGLLLLVALSSWVTLPPSSGGSKKSGSMLKFLSDPGILLDSMSIITALMFIGFNAATLEPHLRQFSLSPVMVGLIFVITGSIYGVTSPFWGYLCDKGVSSKWLCVIGCVLQCVNLLFLGPAPFIPAQPKLWLVILALVIGGFGLASKIVCAFIGILQDALWRGFPNDTATHGMVSALFSSSCSIGAFAGPSLGGFLLDHVGFRTGSVVYLALEFALLLASIAYLLMRRRRRAVTEEVAADSEQTALLLTK